MPKAASVPRRCDWCLGSPEMIDYHDQEWGVPIHDDRRLFEHLVLGGAQAGLSWSTVLNRRDGYRRAFAAFDAERVASFGARQRAALMRDRGIVRNRQKIASAIGNARAVLAVSERFGSLDAFLWRFVDGRPVVNRHRTLAEVPPRSALSDAMSKELRSQGFSFVGTTICYAVMQAGGMINDHLVTCHRHRAVARER
jgi:DNA-3-methyladenine glycosylase I